MSFSRLVLFQMLCAIAAQVTADERVVLYALSQPYWDIQPRDTLGEIVHRLLPADAPQLHRKVMHRLVTLNPHAFIKQDPNRMLAGQRLWFSVKDKKNHRAKTNRHYKIERFSWGYIKREK